MSVKLRKFFVRVCIVFDNVGGFFDCFPQTKVTVPDRQFDLSKGIAVELSFGKGEFVSEGGGSSRVEFLDVVSHAVPA